MTAINIGTASWSIARQSADAFPKDGSSLERYAAQFYVAEINSSFYRPHRVSTWARWKDSTPDSFRFSVKMPKLITHQYQLVGCHDLIDDFLSQVHALDHKLGVLLVQLPPKLEYGEDLARQFFETLRSKTPALVVCEPRHASWFAPVAEALFVQQRIARAAADPAICAEAATPGGWPGLRYWRLHGSPVMYRSSYTDRLVPYARLLHDWHEADRESWCIFDNTASGAATADALALKNCLNTMELGAGNKDEKA